jgi:aspartate aminotransferase
MFYSYLFGFVDELMLTSFFLLQTKNGRISMAGLNTNNIDYFAEAVDSVVRESA